MLVSTTTVKNQLWKCDWCGTEQETTCGNPFYKMTIQGKVTLSNITGLTSMDVCLSCLQGSNIAPLVAFATAQQS